MQVSRVICQSPSPKIIFKKLERKDTKPDPVEIYNYGIAKKVIDGEYGNGDERSLKLGAQYQTIQGIVNQISAGTYNYEKILGKTEYTGKVVDNPFLKEVGALANKDLLQSYSFELSKSDVNGSFSITLFPKKEDKEKEDLNRIIDLLDIVEIYESSVESNLRKFDESSNSVYDANEKPVFVGIVKEKKYISQVTDGGVVRRFNISGIAATGLVSQFYLNLDTTAMAMTKQINSITELNKTLATQLLRKPGTDLPLKEAVNAIWEKFIEIADQCGTPAIENMIRATIGASADLIFDIDDSVFRYPLACIFNGEQTQDFYSLIDGLAPEPVYEKFAYMDSDKKVMRIKIRKVPFSMGEWKNIRATTIRSTEVKNFSLSQSDKEVYTVFFTYLNGYPKDESFLMRVATLEENKSNPTLVWNEEKYKIYGYRPLVAHFIGYGLPSETKESDDTTTQKALQDNSREMMEWFGKLDEMLSGSITLAMTYNRAKPIMPGEKISFLGCEFYVEGISHSWTYGNNGDITLSVSRGGDYSNGIFAKPENLSGNMKLIELANGD